MNINRIVLLILFNILLLLLSKSWAYNPNDVITYSLGKQKCSLISEGSKNGLIHFIALHENEQTAVQAFTELGLNLNHVHFFQIMQKGNRYIHYEWNGRNYSLDPNRIFSIKGVRNTLKNENKGEISNSLIQNVHFFAEEILEEVIPTLPNTYVVAIHNNTNESYSIRSYISSKEAEKVYINRDEDVDNFFLVTLAEDFEYFKSLGRNVALQSTHATDDGSLSVYCHQRNIPYINIEAEFGHTFTQARMIAEVYWYVYLKQKLQTTFGGSAL